MTAPRFRAPGLLAGLLPTVLAAFCTLGLAPAGAEDQAPTGRPAGAAPGSPQPSLAPEEAADAVLGAWGRGDHATLGALAGRDRPDPWLVADVLVGRGAHAAADAFARAAVRVDTERLAAYVTAQSGKPDDAHGRARLQAVRVARSPAAALEALGPPTAVTNASVVATRLAFGRGRVLADSRRPREAATAFVLAAQAGERIGWWALAMQAYSDAGLQAHAGGDFPAAAAALQQALELARRRGERVTTARMYANLGVLRYECGDYLLAREALALAHAEQTALGDAAGAANTLANLGGVHLALGDHEQALDAFEQARPIQERQGNGAGAAATLSSIAEVHAARGEFDRALEVHERALAEMLALGDEGRAAIARLGVGAARGQRGEFAEALDAYSRALAAFQKLGLRAWQAKALGGLAEVHASRGSFAAALTSSEQALALQEALGARPAVAVTLGQLGALHARLGNPQKALTLHERALVEQEAIASRAGVVRALGSVGADLALLGDFDGAVQRFERALAGAQALGDQAAVASNLVLLASALADGGDPGAARAARARALAAYEALGNEGGIARVLASMGVAHARAGEHDEALMLLQRALALFDARGARDAAARTLAHVATIHLDRGAFPQALESARRAAELVGASVQGLGAEEGADAREPLAGAFVVGASAARASGSPTELAYFLEAGRAGALLEGLQVRDALLAASVPPVLRAAEIEARAGEARALMALRRAAGGRDRAAQRAARSELDVARDRVAATVARIQREARAAAALTLPVPATLEALQATLDPGDALVLYALLPATSCALVVARGETRIVELGATPALEAAIDAVALDRPADVPPTALAELARLTVTPLALPPGVRRVLVSPSGALTYVPLAALVPDKTVVYVPSGTTYALLREDEPLRGEGVLALGDPDYATKVDERALQVHRGGAKSLPPLPGTRVEAKAVGTLTLLGAEATEAGLAAALTKQARWRSVHLACHGLVNMERPALSSLAITASGDDDGFLSCLDVFRMKIPADLVVLSACETGKGKINKAEGLVGFTRAFMFAGAPRVLCSLWKVDDEATAALMTKFYELWNPKDGKPGLPTAEALRAAQQHVRSQEQWKHPYYWAAWVLWGLP